MHLTGIGTLLPDWVLGWLVVAAIGGAIIGLPKRLVFGFAAPPAFRWVILPAIGPWFATQPLWFQAVTYLAVALLAAQSVLRLVFGKEAAGHFAGTMLVRIFDCVVLGAFRGAAGLVRRLLVSP
jgi:hypothetical protein